jgi:hypothetical protein
MDARENAQFRRQKHVLIRPLDDSFVEKHEVILDGVEDTSQPIAINHEENQNPSNGKDLHKRESNTETAGYITDRGSVNQNLEKSTFSLLKNDVNKSNSELNANLIFSGEEEMKISFHSRSESDSKKSNK